MTLITIKKIEEKLPFTGFIRAPIFLVALDKIEYIQRNRIIIQEKQTPIGNSYKTGFYNRIEDVNILKSKLF